MDNLLQKQNVQVATDCDRVVLTIGRTEIPMPYAAALRIAQGIRVAAREAMRVTGESRADWRERSKLDEQEGIKPVELNTDYRRTRAIKKFDWQVGFQSELVKILLGNLEIRVHFEPALKIANWLNIGAKQAKAWAGDTRKGFIVTGSLTDAEQNYKHGLH